MTQYLKVSALLPMKKGWQEMTDRSPRLEASECQSKHTVKFHPASSLSSLTAAVLQTAARRPRESEKYDDERRQADLHCDGHWDAHCVLRALAIVPLFFSLFFFCEERSSEKAWSWPLLSIMDDDRSQVDENLLLLPFRDEIWKVWTMEEEKGGCWPERKMMLG